jgi:transcriptional regulator with XRE-family HTH domain
MSNSNSSFAERLQRVRESAGLSQYEVARRAGISKQAMSQLEKGENDPSWSTVQKLAMVLGVDCREFTDPEMALPEAEDRRPPGRPPKAAEDILADEEPTSPPAVKGKAKGAAKKGKGK